MNTSTIPTPAPTQTPAPTPTPAPTAAAGPPPPPADTRRRDQPDLLTLWRLNAAPPYPDAPQMQAALPPPGWAQQAGFALIVGAVIFALLV